MNRQQAKIIGELSDEILGAIEKPRWVTNREFIVAFGEGKDIRHDGHAMADPRFVFAYKSYSIVEPTQTINGIECPIYLKEGELKDGQEYFIEVIEKTNYSTNYIYHGCEIDSMFIERKIAHLTEENAVKCCKARHGVE